MKLKEQFKLESDLSYNEYILLRRDLEDIGVLKKSKPLIKIEDKHLFKTIDFIKILIPILCLLAPILALIISFIN